jgi:hypothetical protein
MKSKLFSVVDALQGFQSDWYETEKNTALLIKAVLSSLDIKSFSGDDLWNLVRLTWITVKGQDVAPDNWKHLKVPALASLFNLEPVVLDDLPATIKRMGLPSAVAMAAVRTTGMVNFRNVWRNSCRHWCKTNRKLLIGILHDASRLSPNVQERFDLAIRIEALPSVSSPNGKSRVGAPIVLTPSVACLDQSLKFPIINGKDKVRDLLRGLKLTNGDLERQVKGRINLIGQIGIEDAMIIDVLADKIKEAIPSLLPEQDSEAADDEGTDLPYLDEAERLATINSKTIKYRNRHNTMTDRLKHLFAKHVLKQGKSSHCRYDVLIKDYDRKGRDLLIEVKPDPDRGGIRIAVGQLLDYRRHLPNRLGTDLALLTITPPPQPYIEFLFDVQISVLWFTNETCRYLQGAGNSWSALKKAL